MFPLPKLTSCIMCADLHLSDDPLNEYRWGFLPWLRERAKEHGIKDVAILGDLTDAKDRHSAKLVNRIVGELSKFSERLIILKGNHDYIDSNNPFFDFVNLFNHVKYATNWSVIKFGGVPTLLLPHTSDLDRDWPKLKVIPQLCLTHLTVKNARGDNGQKLPGVPKQKLAELGMPIFSGDVHVAQVIGPVEYIGAPYDIKFGDRSTRSAIMFDAEGERHDLFFSAPRKRIIKVRPNTNLEELDVEKGDMVQFQVQLDVDQIDDAPQMRAALDRFVSDRGLHCVGQEMSLQFAPAEVSEDALPDVGMAAAFESYCKTHGLAPELVAVGQKCLDKALRNLNAE